MNKLIVTFLFLLSSSINAAPKYGPYATPLSARSNLEYFKKNEAPDYWTLSSYYVPQETPRGCSAANLTMLLNAARAPLKLEAADELITVDSLLEKYTDKDYKKAILGKTLTTGTNFSNQNLARLLRHAIEKLKIVSAETKVEQVIIDPKDSSKFKNQFIQALEENDKSANDFIFFSFVQGHITGDPEGGAHVATIAAYDRSKKLVLIMDSDRKWYEPYWAPLDEVYKSMENPKSDSRKEAGWIYFKVR